MTDKVAVDNDDYNCSSLPIPRGHALHQLHEGPGQHESDLCSKICSTIYIRREWDGSETIPHRAAFEG